jgi:hypothetical protein
VVERKVTQLGGRRERRRRIEERLNFFLEELQIDNPSAAVSAIAVSYVLG